MAISAKAKKVLSRLSEGQPKLGDIKKLGKEISTDHALAEELWATGEHVPRLLASLIFDRKRLSENDIERFADDLRQQDRNERNQIGDWLLANQLSKDKQLTRLLESWDDHSSPVLRRFYWYHQARQRWTGRMPPAGSSAGLLDTIESRLASEEPDVQWTMNFCVGWIGVYEESLRKRCIELGERHALYRDEPVAKNCTPSYLPEFIRIEVGKRQ